eukprot:TRINITY_DN8563_c0_g1_i1.p1 TRINITY_DN8563_c0_g1~~TRINITY_DN8563_c0_g1_i1.p1  ORF type:complete len:532 (+),score=116.19 TRINITY_DN8563_c0_g1_i1:27-1598(+)
MAEPSSPSRDGVDKLVDKFRAGLDISAEDLASCPSDTFVRPSEETYKRPPHQRVFVNRPLRLDKIDWFGFDMDYTLAVYKPEYEEVSYNLIMDRLVQMGYPAEIKTLPYDPLFAVRGLFLDKELGNFLKIDSFGNIIRVLHAKTILEKSDVAKLYPSMMIRSDEIDKRYYLLNTLFNIPEACVFAHLIQFFEGRRDATSVPSSGAEEEHDTFVPAGQDVIRTEAMDIYFKNLWADIRESTDWCHLYTFKSTVVADMSKYLVKTPKLAEFLDTLRKNNRKTFLLTNSPWGYTNSVMSFLLDDEKPGEYKSWLDYFDYVIVDAAKPYFFAQGNTLREVDVHTGRLKISRVEGGGAKVYSGGSIAKFEKLANITNGSGVLYVGDHIFSDVRISKKKHGWRTFLVVPELEKELATWLDPETQKYHRELVTLHRVKAAIYRDFTAESKNPPDLKRIRKSIHQSALRKDDKFNAFFGSLFGSGLQSSFFAMQVQRYADLYAPQYYALLHYPLWYTFSAEPNLQPHEVYI